MEQVVALAAVPSARYVLDALPTTAVGCFRELLE